jgi:hypothetical protein
VSTSETAIAAYRARGAEAAARFRGEESVNLVRATIAVALVIGGSPSLGLALACFVLVVAALVRTGEVRIGVSLITIGIDTTVLAWGMDDGSRSDLAGAVMASVGVLLATARLSPALVLGAALHAVVIVRGGELMNHLSIHDLTSRPPYAGSYAFVPAVVGLALAAITARVVSRSASKPSADALDETAGYRAPATGTPTALSLCSLCSAPVTGATTCALCGVDLGSTPPLDAVRVRRRVLDPRASEWALKAALPVAGIAIGSAFVSLLAAPDASRFAIINAALFVVATLLPLVTYLRSSRAKRGELLTAAGLPRALGRMLTVVLGLSLGVLFFAAAIVIASSVCSGIAMSFR